MNQETKLYQHEKQRSGTWILDWEMGMSICSCCGETYLWEDHKGTADFHYCPNCGVKMEAANGD